MKRYTVFCTPEQTKKALELGAPIEYIDEAKIKPIQKFNAFYLPEKWGYLVYPTTEEMIGWLEEQEVAIILKSIMDGDGIGYCWIAHTFNYNEDVCMKDDKMQSRKEATLAAIDAALEYLIKNKK